MRAKISYEIGSDNIYNDLGYNEPDEMIIKAGLALKIIKIVNSKKLTKMEVSKLTGISQDKISNISRILPR